MFELAKQRDLELLGEGVRSQIGLLDIQQQDCAPPTPARRVNTFWLWSTYGTWDLCSMLFAEASRTMQEVAARGNTLAIYHGSLALADVNALASECEKDNTLGHGDPGPYLAAVRARVQLAMGVTPSGQIVSHDRWKASPPEWAHRFIKGTREFWLNVSRDSMVSVSGQWPLSVDCDLKNVLRELDSSDLWARCSSVKLVYQVFSNVEGTVEWRESLAASIVDIRARFSAFMLLGDELLRQGDVQHANSMYRKAIEPARDGYAQQLLSHHPMFRAVRARVAGVAEQRTAASARP